MKTIESKLNVISKIGALLNDAGITWAVGASMLLYFKGITSEFNDIDIMVTEEDVPQLKEILLSIGSIAPPNPNEKYRTKHFMEFVVDGIDIDVMAGFVIVDNGKEYDCALLESQIVDSVTVNHVKIPLQSVALWKEYYKLMRRDHKVAMIDNATNPRLQKEP